MVGLLLPDGSQLPEQERDLCRELALGGIGAAELVDQLRDDDGCLLRADAGVLLVSVYGDQEIGVQIASGAQAEVAEVGAVPVQRAIGVDVAGAMLVPIGGRAGGRLSGRGL